MPSYDFRCTLCGKVEEDFCTVTQAKAPRRCLCGGPMRMTFTAMNYIASEFKSLKAWSPTLKHDVQTHGDHYDMGLGAWVRDKSHRKALMKAKGLREVGTDWDRELRIKDAKEEGKANSST